MKSGGASSRWILGVVLLEIEPQEQDKVSFGRRQGLGIISMLQERELINFWM